MQCCALTVVRGASDKRYNIHAARTVACRCRTARYSFAPVHEVEERKQPMPRFAFGGHLPRASRQPLSPLKRTVVEEMLSHIQPECGEVTPLSLLVHGAHHFGTSDEDNRTRTEF